MRVSQLMNRTLVTVSPGTRATEAGGLAARAGAHHVLVMEGGELLGIACRCDLDQVAEDEPIAECMSVPVLTIPPEATAEEAADTLRQCDVGCLPVMGGGRILGTIAEEDLRSAGFRTPRRAHGRDPAPV